MSPPPPPSPSSPSSSPSFSFKDLGLGYAIAIAFGFLVLFSALLLSSYLCFRTRRRRRRLFHAPTFSSTSDGGVIVPRVIFVAEDDDNDEENQNRGSVNGVVGLGRAVINSYPKFQFSKKNLLESNNGGGDSNNLTCSICLCDYKEGEMLRMMPDCKHYFHLCCLDAWLKLNGSCPVCRNSPLPTPVSTPLAEVVPLSHYPDNRHRSTVISSS